jgi:hypothetical protein
MTPLLDFLMDMEASEEISRRDHSLVGSLLRHRLLEFLSGAELNPRVAPYEIEMARRQLMEMDSIWPSRDGAAMVDGAGRMSVDWELLSEVLRA